MYISVSTFHPESGFSYSEDLAALDKRPAGAVTWVDVETKNAEFLGQVAAHFGLHELTVEDCLVPGHFPKLEDFGNYTFLLFRGLKADITLETLAEEEDDEEAQGEQSPERALTYKVGVCVGKDFVITIRRQEVTWLDAILRQIKTYPEMAFKQGPWTLAHRVVDVLIDRFVRSLVVFDRYIDKIEDETVEEIERFDMSEVLLLKRRLMGLRKVMREQRSIISQLAHSGLIIQNVQLRRYFKDVDDHAVEILNVLDKQIDNVAGLRDAYYAMANVQLNDTMRVLAVIATVAAPLNIVVGIYGMNFEEMPFLKSASGFWIIITIMITLVSFMLFYFWRKRWI